MPTTRVLIVLLFTALAGCETTEKRPPMRYSTLDVCWQITEQYSAPFAVVFPR